MRGIEEPIVQAVTYLRMGLQATYRVEGLDVCLQHIAQNLEGAREILFAGWVSTQQITLNGVDIWLIERHPEIAEIMQAQFGHYGIVRLRAQDIVSWLDHIDFCLRNSPSPVRLPQMAEQLLLPSFDHIEIK